MHHIHPHQCLVLSALGNPVRQEIVHLLSQKPMSVGEIALQLPVSRPAISKHLKLLKNAKLIQAQSVGTRNIYKLDESGFQDAKQWLNSFWDDGLARYKLLAENTKPEFEEA